MISSENTVCSSATASTLAHIQQLHPKIPVMVLLGPTAVGKSSLALKLAKELDMEIVSCDSRQIYRGMDIGTDKVAIEIRNTTPHWLIDIIDPDEPYSAFRFAHDAAAVLRERSAAGKRVIICGGTGLYFKLLSEGGEACVDSDPAVRDELTGYAATNGSAALHSLLKEVDPAFAEKIHPNDTQRCIRALAVYRQTGKPLSSYQQGSLPTTEFDFNIIKLTRPREFLYNSINKRVCSMIKNGLYNEFKTLRGKGYGQHSPGMQAVGYRELFDVEQGVATIEEAVSRIQRSTRNYAKRQVTWFSKQAPGETFDADTDYNVFRTITLKHCFGVES